MKKYLLTVLLLLAFVRLLFIDPKHSHDWGDDFAQYIHQAVNLAEGIPQSQTGYIYNPENAELGPHAYPIGFPALLSVVYLFFGNNIHAFWGFMSLCLVFLGVALFYFHKRSFSGVTAFALAFILVYNPWMLLYKAEVMSEIPFTLFVILSFIFYTKAEAEKNKFMYLLAGLTVAYAILIRSMGWCIPLALVTDQVLKYFSSRKQNGIGSLNKTFFIWNLIPIIILVMAVSFLVPLPGGYDKPFDWQHMYDIVMDHITYNQAVFHAYFTHYDVSEYKFMLLLTASAMVVFFVIGLVKKMIESPDVYTLFTIIYLLVIFMYRHGDAGFRFLLPVFPFMMNHVVIGIKSIDIKYPFSRKYLGLLLFVVMLLQYQKSIRTISKCNDCEIPGPYDKSSVEVFEYIKNNTNADARFMFSKPRALALLTNRSGYIYKEKDHPNDILPKAIDNGIGYVLLHNDMIDDSVKAMVQRDSNQLKEQFKNDKFVLYKIELK